MKTAFLATVLAAVLLTGVHQISFAQGANEIGGESDADNSTASNLKAPPDTKTVTMPKTPPEKAAIPNSAAKVKPVDPAPKRENK